MFNNLKKYLSVVSLLFAAFVLYGAKAQFVLPENTFVPYNPGEIKGHLQGFTAIGQHLYWVSNHHILKTDSKGNVIKRVLLKKENQFRRHGGDPCSVDDKLYIPYCSEKFCIPIEGRVSMNFVQVYDKDLNYLKTYHLPQIKYGAGCMTYADGQFFVSGGKSFFEDGNSIYVYDRDFNFIRENKIAVSSRSGIQTLTFDGKDFWLGFYGRRPLQSLRLSKDFELLGAYKFSGSTGILALQDNKMLISDYTVKSAKVIDPEKFKYDLEFVEIDHNGIITYRGKKYTNMNQFYGQSQDHIKSVFVVRCSAKLSFEKWLSIKHCIPALRIVMLKK